MKKQNVEHHNPLIHSPSSSVFSLVQLVLSLTFLKCGCFSLSPVSNTATFTPEPLAYTCRKHSISSDKPPEPRASRQVASRSTWYRPVCPICQRTSAWRIWATWRGMARSRRLLEWRPVACQKPEPSDRLVRRNGRDDCHDCHFCVPRVALQGAEGSGAAETRETKMQLSAGKKAKEGISQHLKRKESTETFSKWKQCLIEKSE